ncbi:ABC transporter permease [Acidobacteriota bacterium]
MKVEHPPRIAESILKFITSRKYKTDLLGDTEEEYRRRRAAQGKFRSDLWYLTQVFIPIPYFIRTSVFWALSMFMNYMKIALRIMRRNKGPSVINTVGLAVGMACFILTIVWVQYEFSYDRFHSQTDRIYRTLASFEGFEGPQTQSGAPLPLGQTLKDNYPEVMDYTRYRNDQFFWRVQADETVSFENRVAHADPSFLEIFDFVLIQGDKSTALNDTKSIVITEKTAAKYFGSSNPMGEPILFMDNKYPMYVTGVMKDLPKNSHFQFDMLINLYTADELWDIAPEDRFWDDWRLLPAYSLYLVLDEKISGPVFSQKISGILGNYDPEAKATLSVQPLKEVHLYSDVDYDYDNIGRGSIRYIYLFVLISFIVLLIACINFMSLSTARSLKRVREVGIRKVNGAYRLDIIKQFMGESFVHSFTALVFAVFLAYSFLPTLRAFSGRDLELNLLATVPLIISILAVGFLTGMVSGLYPAFFASSYDPVKIIKKTSENRKYSFLRMRQVLVSLQFICTTVLIIVTLVILMQLHFMQKKDLGYDKNNIIHFNVSSVRKQLDAFKTELKKNPNIIDVAAGGTPTWGVGGHRFGAGESNKISWEGKTNEEIVLMDMHFADYDYLKTYKLTLLEGRWFSREISNDRRNYVVTESAVKVMNLDDPTGKIFKFGDREGQIIGVVKDFHGGTLRNEIYPSFFMCVPNLKVSVRIEPQDMKGTLEYIEATWKKFVPERPINFTFLDDSLESLYSSDKKLGQIVTNYTIISLLISCLGLFGLVSFMAEHKTKEIGIRKVLGAPISSIVGIISREFIPQVLLATLIAFPVGYLITSSWLKAFAFNIGFEVWIYLVSGVLVVLLAYLTVGYKTLKAAFMNPVDSIRYE